MDWLAKMIGLPNDFLHSHADTTGGGVIQVEQTKNSNLNLDLFLFFYL